MKRFLTEMETRFAIGYLNEQLEGIKEQREGVKGPAFTWIEENGLAHGDFQPFTLHLTLTLGVNQLIPPKPDEYPAPWASVEEFRARAAELRATLAEARSQAEVEWSAARSSTEELGDG